MSEENSTVLKNNTIFHSTLHKNHADDTFFFVSCYINLITTLLGISGNALVLYISQKTWKISAHYKLIVGLATSDLVYSVLFVIYIVQYIGWGHWIYPPWTCHVLDPVMSTTIYLDIGFILIICIERYMSICHSLTSVPRSRFIMRFLVLLNFIFALLSVMPLHFTMMFNEKKMSCLEKWEHPVLAKFYTIYLLTFYFLFPMIGMIFLYKKCVGQLKRITDMLLETENDNLLEQKRLENQRIFRIVCCLVFIFFLFVLPSWFCFLIQDYVQLTGADKDFIDGFSSLTFPMHCLCNPIIYSFVDERVRSILKKAMVGVFPIRQNSRDLLSLTTIARSTEM